MIRILFPKQNSRPASDIFTDVIFGSLIDKTQTKLGKARPWMLFPYIGCSVMLAAIFAIPTTWGDVAKYAYFFITYTLLNAVFYTANNIAHSALTALITKNGNERVQMGSIRFIFAFGTSRLIQSVTVKAVDWCGGGIGTALTGWLLAAGDYVANAAVQPESCINMLHFMYLWLPMIFNFIMTLLLSRLNVEKANADWDREHQA
ncbi:MAG: MFS transporter [Oscillospiraceae bacterium]|nr:MFS transporter [Oscillospiraceae bacterium]